MSLLWFGAAIVVTICIHCAVRGLNRFGNETKELFHTLLVRTIRDVVQWKLMQYFMGAWLLNGNTFDANCDLKFLELLLCARLRFLHLLSKLQLTYCFLDHLNALGLIQWIKIAIGIGIQEKFIHFLAIALATAAAVAHLAGQVAPGRHNWQEGIGRRRMGRGCR